MDEDQTQPPIQAPPVQPPTPGSGFYQPVFQPAPKKKPVWLFIILGAFVLLCGGGVGSVLLVGKSDSGLRYHGKVLSKGEVIAIEQDFRQLLRPGESAIDFSAHPNTDFGQEFLRLSKAIDDNEKLMADAEPYSFKAIMDPKRLATESGRKRSLGDAIKFEAVSKTYFSTLLTSEKALSMMLTKANGQPCMKFDDIELKIKQSQAKWMNCIDLAKQGIAVAQRTRPHLDGSGSVLMFAQGGEDDYNNIVDKYNASLGTVTSTMREVNSESSRRMSESFGNLDKVIEHLADPLDGG